ncbi:hypothetical protein L3V83_09400 [Thiotrichales bacterium 19X7-9]|nr:hypothetical protein [Thiotrichales bacterium 19X7-9]
MLIFSKINILGKRFGFLDEKDAYKNLNNEFEAAYEKYNDNLSNQKEYLMAINLYSKRYLADFMVFSYIVDLQTNLSCSFIYNTRAFPFANKAVEYFENDQIHNIRDLLLLLNGEKKESDFNLGCDHERCLTKSVLILRNNGIFDHLLKQIQNTENSKFQNTLFYQATNELNNKNLEPNISFKF